MKNKVILSILTLAVAFSFVLTTTMSVLGADLGGSGTKADPYKITSAADLVMMKDKINSSSVDDQGYKSAFYRLDADITVPAPFTSMGTATNKFTGDFNGNTKKLTGLEISSDDDNQGLFGYISGDAKVYNLILADCNITGAGGVGAIAGAMEGNAKISGCITSGKVKATGINDSEVGGIVGYMAGSNVFVAKSNSSCAVSATGAQSIVGGLVGVLSSGASVNNCFATGILTGAGDNTIGGLVGVVEESKISDSYFNGTISGSTAVGYIAGSMVGGEIDNCYFKSTNAANKVYGSKNDAATVTASLLKEAGAFQSGEVANLLQGGQGKNATLLWGQNITNKPFDSAPGLTIDDKLRVCQVELIDKNESQNSSIKYVNKGQKIDVGTKAGFSAKVYTDEAMKTTFDYKTKTITDDNNRFYIAWEAAKFTVKFDSDGGSAIADISAASGAKIAKPTDPTKTGFTFAGWYTDKKYTTAWDFTKSTVTADTTLYAKWNTASAAPMAATSNKANPKAGDEGIPVIYFILFGVAAVGASTAAGILIWRKHQGY